MGLIVDTYASGHHLLGGASSLSGTAKQNGAGVSATVWLIDIASRSDVERVTAAENGTFAFSNIAAGRSYELVGYASDGTAGIVSNVDAGASNVELNIGAAGGGSGGGSSDSLMSSLSMQT